MAHENSPIVVSVSTAVVEFVRVLFGQNPHPNSHDSRDPYLRWLPDQTDEHFTVRIAQIANILDGLPRETILKLFSPVIRNIYKPASDDPMCLDIISELLLENSVKCNQLCSLVVHNVFALALGCTPSEVVSLTRLGVSELPPVPDTHMEYRVPVSPVTSPPVSSVTSPPVPPVTSPPVSSVTSPPVSSGATSLKQIAFKCFLMGVVIAVGVFVIVFFCL